jgi:hypothetical protein
MFSSPTLIKHYTPPTCRLEIYSNRSIFFRKKSNKIPAQFNFNLHFDDPRLPAEKRITIQGDRSCLDLLSESVRDYISELLQENKAKTSKESNQNSKPNKNNDIYLINKGLLNQELSYSSKSPNNQKTIIKLTTLQLFDLANTLDKYTLDLNNWQEEEIDLHQKSTFISLTAMFLLCLGLGGIWWRDRQISSQEESDRTRTRFSREDISSALEDILPPQALNPETIPPVPQLQLPSNLQNRQTLPPPSPILAQPPNQENKTNSSNQLNPPPQGEGQNNQNSEKILIPPPPQRPLPSPPISSQPIPTSPQVISLNPNPQALPSQDFTSSDAAQNELNPRRSVSSVPVLQSISASAPAKNIDNGLNNAVSVLPEKIQKIPSSFDSRSSQPPVAKVNISEGKATHTEVKQYFQQKWQPPENLNQSIEYRLIVNNDGSVNRVIPMGQASVTFLDRTGMPLMGEAIASSFPQTEPSTIRLILRPNGDVETFLEG